MENLRNAEIRLLFILPFVILDPLLLYSYLITNEIFFALLLFIGEFVFIGLFYALFKALLGKYKLKAR
jgi:hypothetical protein